MHIVLRFFVRVFTLPLGLLVSLPAVFVMINTLIRRPALAFKKTKRTYPTLLTEASLGRHDFITLPTGQRIHYVENGPRNAPLMLCLHGFPEFWFSWRNQLTFFSKQYRVVAIDMRGFGESSKPSTSWWGSDAYAMPLLMEDVRGVIEALGYKSCVLMGHDWGGIVAWSFAANYQSFVDRLVILNCPHPACFKKNISLKQLAKSWYILFYQVPLLPELFLAFGDYMLLKAAFASPRMGYKQGKVSEEELNAYKWSLSQPGATTATLNYYRQLPVADTKFKPIAAPTLVVWGEADGALGKELLDNMSPRWVSDVTVKLLPGVSHWVQCDAPEQVNTAVDAFLREKGV